MPTPLLPAGSVRNSKRKMKFANSLTVKKLPPPSLGHTRLPSLTIYPGPFFSTSVHPSNDLQSKSGTKEGSLAVSKATLKERPSRIDIVRHRMGTARKLRRIRLLSVVILPETGPKVNALGFTSQLRM